MEKGLYKNEMLSIIIPMTVLHAESEKVIQDIIDSLVDTIPFEILIVGSEGVISDLSRFFTKEPNI